MPQAHTNSVLFSAQLSKMRDNCYLEDSGKNQQHPFLLTQGDTTTLMKVGYVAVNSVSRSRAITCEITPASALLGMRLTLEDP